MVREQTKNDCFRTTWPEGHSWGTPPPLEQARPRSQKSGQTSGSTPTPCLDKPVLTRDTHDSKARYVTAMPMTAMFAVAENHIQTNRMGLHCCYEQNVRSQT